MILEPLRKRDRARFLVDSAVHDLHLLILTEPYASVRASEVWLNVFCSFPRLDGAKAFLRGIAAMRDLLPAESWASLDAEVAKVKAAYLLASKLIETNKAKERKRLPRNPNTAQPSQS